MIKYNLKALIADKEFKNKKKITYEEISKATGISRQTLSKISSVRGQQIGSKIIEKLCIYFDVTPDQFMTIIPDEQ